MFMLIVVLDRREGTTLVMSTNKNVHRFTHNLHGIKIMMVESFP